MKKKKERERERIRLVCKPRAGKDYVVKTMVTRNETQSPHPRLSQRLSVDKNLELPLELLGGAERLLSGQVRSPECPQVTREMS